MKITNNHGLPEYVVDAIKENQYDKGESDITTTTLIAPPKSVLLIEQNYDKIVVDAMDLLHLLDGDLVHLLLERSPTKGRKEERFYWTHADSGYKIGGQVDFISVDGIMDDTKRTSVYKAKRGMSPDWEQQLNINAFLCRVNQVYISAVRIFAWMKDWSYTRGLQDWTYPKHQAIVIPARLWTQEEQYDFIDERVAKHFEARESGILEPCTDSERWIKERAFKCMRNKNIKSSKNCTTLEEAQEWIDKQKKPEEFRIVESPKEFNKCARYCLGNRWCDQYQKEQNDKKDNQK